MTTIKEYQTLCEQQRKLIELLLADQRNRINPPIVVPSTLGPSIVPQGPWYTPTITSRSDGHAGAPA